MLGASLMTGLGPYVTCLHSSQSEHYNTNKISIIKRHNSGLTVRVQLALYPALRQWVSIPGTTQLTNCM